VLQTNPHRVVLDDPQDKIWFLSRILDSKRPDLLVPKLNSSKAITIRILQKIRGNQPSLPILIYFNSVTEQFENQGVKGRAWSFFEKQIGHKSFVLRSEDQLLDRMKKLSLPEGGSVNNIENMGASSRISQKSERR
jgi:DNA-binding NtrC family response regulator